MLDLNPQGEHVKSLSNEEKKELGSEVDNTPRLYKFTLDIEETSDRFASEFKFLNVPYNVQFFEGQLVVVVNQNTYHFNA